MNNADIGRLERCMDFVDRSNEERDFITMRKMTRNNSEGRKAMRNQWIISEAMSIDEIFDPFDRAGDSAQRRNKC